MRRYSQTRDASLPAQLIQRQRARVDDFLRARVGAQTGFDGGGWPGRGLGAGSAGGEGLGVVEGEESVDLSEGGGGACIG